MAFVSLQSVFAEAQQALQSDAADKAIGRLQHILVYFPHFIDGHQLLGEVYLHIEQPEQAVPAFEHVLRVDPEHVAAYYGLGLAWLGLKQEPKAITMFEHMLEIQPNLRKLRTQVRRFYAESTGSSSQFRLTRVGLGRLYARGGLFEQAISEFQAAREAEPDRIDVQVALAEALWRAGRNNEAAEFCRDLLGQCSELLKPSLLLSYMRIMAGQPEGATLWRRAATYDPAMTMARALFEELPSIEVDALVLPLLNDIEWQAQAADHVGDQPLTTAETTGGTDKADTLSKTAPGAEAGAVPSLQYHSEVTAQRARPVSPAGIAHATSDPQNASLRLAIARMNWESGDTIQSFQHYKQLVRQGVLLEEVVGDLQDAIADAEEPDVLRKLHRLLGDAYMKQQRLQEAMEAYSWTPD